MCSKSEIVLCFAAISVFYSVIPSVSSDRGRYEVYYEWKQIDYNFPSSSVRDELIQNGEFVQINCVPNAVKIHRDQLFIATPRYFKGVPSTLNVVSYKKSYWDQVLKRNAGPKLTPFPSWEMQEIGDCSALQLVQSMETDSYNRLWVLDVGRVELLTPTPRNLCPAKLVIFDLADGNRIEKVYEFPPDVVQRESNAIKDMQIACNSREDCMLYISNINSTTRLVMYDYKSDESWFAFHSIMEPELAKANFTIEGTSGLYPFGITGLGLSPKTLTDHSTLFFSKVAGDRIYYLPTSVLNDRTTLKSNPVLPNGIIKNLRRKPTGQADGAAMDNKGRWFFGSLPESAVYFIDTNGIGGSDGSSTSPMYYRIGQSSQDMQWSDAFTFDGQGHLLLTTTRFQLVANGLINPEEVNYRLIRFRTDSVSYQN